MSFYNMLFGMNSQTDLLLAVLGLKQCDVERLRNVFVEGATIEVYTRTGGNNREDYPNLTMRKLPGWKGSVDDDYDNTYCTDTFDVPAEFVQDVANLGDPLTHGMRAEFMQHIAKTLRREPTEADKARAAHDAEQQALARTRHLMANGHTFVPLDDPAMEAALKLAEANGGALRSCWGILPIALRIERDKIPYPKALDEGTRQSMIRAEIGYDYQWSLDEGYWKHCQDRWSTAYPLSMAKIADGVAKQLERKRA